MAAISSFAILSRFLALFSNCLKVLPVPAGINLPTITFSLRPSSVSVLPFIDASVRILVVSWKEAAEINDLVDNDALVIPNNIGFA